MCLRGMHGQWRPRSDVTDAQSDQSLRCPLPECISGDTIECIRGQESLDGRPAHAQDDMNPHTLRMLRHIFERNDPYIVRPRRHYEGCSKWIAYFYLETSNFKLAQKYSFHALEVLPVARNAKFQPMIPLLEGVTVRWFGHSNKVLMNGRSKCLSGLVFPPSKECFQFRKQKEITRGKVWVGGGGGGWGLSEAKQLLFFSSKTL